ncbi:MAG: hypothetical protein K8T25_11705 [Planctomycetia bacterium]|nr:hypothetical protein [Planctomycetia bacterium]
MKTTLKLLAVAIIHGVAGVLLYRQGVVSGGFPFDSDFLIFLLPAMIALLANVWIIGASPPAKWTQATRGTLTCGLALVVTFFSTWAYALVALNTYGS